MNEHQISDRRIDFLRLAGIWCAVCASALSGAGAWWAPRAELLAALCLGCGASMLLPQAVRRLRVESAAHRASVMVLLSVMLLSTLAALDVQRALFGSIERSQGLIVLIFAIVLFHAGIARKELTWPVLVVLVANFTLWIWNGLSGALSPWQDRFSGTFGNPAQLGNYALIAVALFLPQLLERASDQSIRRALPDKFFPALICFLAVWLMLLAGSRAAWLALAGVLVFFVCAQFRNRVKNLRTPKKLTIALILALLCSCTFLITSLTQRSESISMRLKIYQAALSDAASERHAEAPADQRFRALLGYGFDLQSVALRKVNTREEFADRAHNLFLDVKLCIGWLGLFALLLCFWQFSKARDMQFWSVLIGAGLALQFSFALNSELALLACALGRSEVGATSCATRPAARGWAAQRFTVFSAAIAALLSYLPVDALCAPNWRAPEYALLQFRVGQGHYREKNYALAVLAFTRAQTSDRYRPEYAAAVYAAQLALESGSKAR